VNGDDVITFPEFQLLGPGKKLDYIFLNMVSKKEMTGLKVKVYSSVAALLIVAGVLKFG